MPIDDALFRTWVAQAARAPSAHNTQPARWRRNGGTIELHEDPSRWLSAGDGSARDQRVALGMAWEAMRLAASVDGWQLAEPALDEVAWPATTATPRRIARAAISTGAQTDPLACWQAHRHCWRGKFLRADTAAYAALSDALHAHAAVVLALPESATPALARLHDRAAAKLLHDAATAHELYRWMRFSPRDARWSCDGLSADCLALGTFQAHAASWLMRPRVLAVLRRLGLLSLLVSESAKTSSAQCLIVIHAAADALPFAVGRAWYRCWLAVTAAGFAAVPMSALVDEPTARAQLIELAALPAGRVAYNVMRIGIPACARVPLSARLNVDALLVAPSTSA